MFGAVKLQAFGSMNWHEVTDLVPSKVIVNMVYFFQSAPVCSSEVLCTDDNTSGTMQINSSILTDPATIEFTLLSDHHCDITIIANNTAGSATSLYYISKALVARN